MFGAVDECVARRIEADPALAAAVHAVVRYGSSERGDFVPGVSDLDYFVVVEGDRAVVPRVEAVLRECAEPVDHRGVDVAWEFRANLGDPDLGVPFKFLTVYQRDFRRHHSVVYGADVTSALPDHDLEDRLSARLDRIERLAAENADDEAALRVLAGETARLRALLDGADSLRKDAVHAALEEHDRTDALEVYEAYLEDRSEALDGAFLRRFVATATDAMRPAE